MNRIIIALFAALLCACSPKYFVNSEGAHIIIDDNDEKHYINDNLQFSTELSFNDGNYSIPSFMDDREKRILKFTGFNHKQDTILYLGRGSMLVLKEKEIDLDKFRVINLHDSVLLKLRPNDGIHNFYRRTTVDKKHKTFIINDLIPFDNRFLQRVEFLETDFNALIDPTDIDDIIYFSEDYKTKIRLTKEAYNNLLRKKRIGVKNPYLLFEDNFKTDRLFNYRTPYILENRSNNYYTPEEKGFFDQMLATYYSFAGDINRSDSVWKHLSQSKESCNCEQTGTKDDLLKIISQNRVVMFNEAHHVPTHRLLVSNLLDTLYNQGFSYLALEAFNGDSLFYKTGYISGDNGYYLREPIFANLVREAYKLGFKVFGYDTMASERERMQAENIYNQTIKQDSTAKVVVLAGWGHIDKNAMAGEFEKISRTAPLTIDQTFAYNKCSKPGNNNEVVMITPNGKAIDTDYYVLNSLQLNGKGKTTIFIPEKIKDFCKIICIYDSNEFDTLSQENKIAVPVCILNDISQPDTLSVNLQKGSYYLIFQDDFGNVLENNIISVE